MAEIDLDQLERHNIIRNGALDVLGNLSDMGFLEEKETVTVQVGEDYITLYGYTEKEDSNAS